MGFHFRYLFFFVLNVGFILNINAQGLRINEIMSSNTYALYDEDGDTPDWLEIINKTDNEINLSDYYLSENPKNLLKWQLPDSKLSANTTLLIFASGKDRKQIPLFWTTIVDIGNQWKYTVPTSELSQTWKNYNFNESGWKTGASGIGYGDNDDNTIVPNGTMSVFMRIKFSLTDIDQIAAMWFHMDYDDGFVAYLNGNEISRAGLGSPGSPVAFNQAAASHDAKIHQGMDPDRFNISNYINLLKENENVLAVQVHNTSAGSSDLTAIPFLTLGYKRPLANAKPVSKYVKLNSLNSHTNFKLSSSGETLSLTHKDGTVIDSISYGYIPSNISYGRSFSSFNNWGYFAQPTPGFPNQTEMMPDIVKGEVTFSISDMFVTSSGYLSLGGAGAGEEIRYTENGEEPTLQSKKYQFGIQLDRNKVIRARIFKPGALPGKIASRTYLVDKKPGLPVISISTSPANLWDRETGIYVLGDTYQNSNPYYGANFWEDWEKPASIEMIGVDGKRMFELNCGIKIFGGWSRAHPQKSLSVFFRNDYGDPVLKDIQLFKAKPNITSYKSFVLRNSGNDYGYTRFRDGMMTNLVRKMDIDIQAFEPVILYLNGEYWGEINLREKVNEDYLERNHGVKANELDLLEGQGNILEGSNEGYLELVQFLQSNNLNSDANYDFVAGQINIDNYIDYQLSQIYFNNRDWPGNNIKYWKSNAEGSKWRWILFDTDFGFGIYNGADYLQNTIQFALEPNGPNWPNPPWSTLLFRRLVENNKFKQKFINRFADMMNTTFVAERVISEIDSIAAIIKPEIERHSVRWNSPHLSFWESSVQTMRNFATNRAQHVRSHINSQFVRANIFDVTLSVVPADAGSIQLNTIEVQGDFWQGKYFENVPIKLVAKTRNGFRFKHWEVNGITSLNTEIEINLKKATLIKAVYDDIDDSGNSIVINEINYNSPSEKNAGDWIELYNWGIIDLDISGWIIKDDDNLHQFVFPNQTIMKRGEYLVICRSATDFNLVHPDVQNRIGDLDFGLGSTGDAVRLFDNSGVLVDSVTYGVESPWPAEPNGKGPTLELVHFSKDNSQAVSWKSSKEMFGTPGRENSISTGTVLLAETQSDNKLRIYPNPFTEETKLRIENNGFEPMNVQIFSMDGKLVRFDSTTEIEYVWRGENQSGQKLQPGIYLCRVQSGKNLYTGKVVIGSSK